MLRNGLGERIFNPTAYYEAVSEDRYGYNTSSACGNPNTEYDRGFSEGYDLGYDDGYIGGYSDAVGDYGGDY